MSAPLHFHVTQPILLEIQAMRSGSWLLISLIGLGLLATWIMGHRTGKR
jgi:hypothetical protein